MKHIFSLKLGGADVCVEGGQLRDFLEELADGVALLVVHCIGIRQRDIVVQQIHQRGSSEILEKVRGPNGKGGGAAKKYG